MQTWYYPRMIPSHLQPGNGAPEAIQRELGNFLRSRREKLSPEAVGLSNERRRRTPGLRREEVAELAGISVDWYIRLEQGRAVSPSVTTVDALARALNFGAVEHAHLRNLAQGAQRRAFVRERVPETIQHLLQSLEQPAYVIGRRWDLLAWNAAAVDVLTDFGRLAEEDRNILSYMLTDPDARTLFGAAWADEAKRMVSQFRGTYDFWAGDPGFLDLVERLRRGSHEFTIWWEAHDIRSLGSGRKRLNHPTRGVLHFEYATFQCNDDPALKLAIYTPV